MFEPYILYLLFGCLAGLLAGLFGIGGGAILVPFLAWQFARAGFPRDAIMIMAVATSLGSIVPTSLASIAAHHRRGAIAWRLVALLSPGLLAGSVAGALIASQLPVPVFKLIFSGFLALVAVTMIKPASPARAIYQWPLTPWLCGFAGVGIGAISAVVGIGGGSLTVPFLAKSGIPMNRAVAISSACGLPIALAATISYAKLGWLHGGLPPASLGYIFIPALIGIALTSVLFAPLGAKLAHQLPANRLKRLFGAVLFAVSLDMFLKTV